MTDDDSKAFRSYIYTNLSEIEKELTARWNNKELRKKVEDFFGSDFLKDMSQRPRAVLSRSIGTPNLELKYFLDLVKEVKLDPLILEYNDKFVAKNHDKYHLCRLFFSKILKNGNLILSDTIKIINFNTYEGKLFADIKTKWGDSIIDFHHKLLHKEVPSLENKTVDFTVWFNKTRQMSDYYYFYYLSLFVCNGVLFENFLVGDKFELDFIQKKFLPSFREVERVFGVKPLIYPLLPFENEKSASWLSYPVSLEKSVKREIKWRQSRFAHILEWFNKSVVSLVHGRV